MAGWADPGLSPLQSTTKDWKKNPEFQLMNLMPGLRDLQYQKTEDGAPTARLAAAGTG